MKPIVLVLASLLAVLCALVCLASPAQALTPAGGGLYFQSAQPFGWNLNQLALADADNLWATADSGNGLLLLHSPDAGITWKPVDLGLDHDISMGGLDFLDAQHARALASWHDGTTATNRIALLASDDGGASWSLQSMPSDGFLEWGSAFVSTEVAFVIGWERKAITNTWPTKLLSTTDGGASWKRTAVACTYPNDLTAIDASHLWLYDSDSHTVWTSSSGGADWKIHTLPLKGEAGTTYYIGTMQALSAKAAWIQVTRRAKPHNIVMRTTDGGQSWRIVRRLERYADGALTAVSASEAWIAVSVDWPSPQQPAYYDHTIDGGATWMRSYVGPRSLGSVTVSPGGALFALGAELSHSTDGGATWTRLIGNRLSYWLNDVAATPDGDLWAVGWTTPSSPGIYGDYDGDQGLLFRCPDGVSWKQQEIRAGSLLCAVDFADSQVGWAAGWNGRVLRTTDGGTTWTARSAPSSLGIHAVKALDADSAVGIAFDENNEHGDVIVRTTDGGASWNESLRPASDLLKSICSLGPGNLLIAGVHYGATKQALLLESADSGATWSERFITCKRTVRDMAFTDAQHGWILASDVAGRNPLDPSDFGSLVLRTTDGGATWQTTDLGKASTGLFAIAFSDNQNGWAFGNQALETSDGGATWGDAGVAMPTSVLGPFWPGPVVRAATSSNGNFWAVGADQLILSTLDTPADTAPPLSSDDGDRRWHDSAVTTHFYADDPAGFGVATTEYRLDAGPWRAIVGGSVTIDAPSDHSGDGSHEIEYRSTDNAGNVEFPQMCAVRIDTRAPATRAGATVRARRGKLCKLAYRVIDANPNGGTATVTITIRRRGGMTVKRLKLGVQVVNTWLSAGYRCRLAPGTYSYVVKATDTAGNTQATIGRGTLVVK